MDSRFTRRRLFFRSGVRLAVELLEERTAPVLFGFGASALGVAARENQRHFPPPIVFNSITRS
jgi:hypothetical protein